MARPVRKLSNMEIDEISLVDKGANQHAMITIAKRAPEEETMPEIYNEDGHLLDENDLQDGQIVFDDEGQAYQFTLDDEDGEYEEADERELEEVGKRGGAGFRDVLSASKHNFNLGHNAEKGAKFSSKAAKAGQGARAVRNHPGRTAAGVAFTGAAGYGGKKAFGKSFSESVMEELSKAYSDEDRDQVISKALGRVEELEAEQFEMAEIAKSERDLRLTREYISKAAEYNLPVDPSELGPVLYRMAETMDYDDCAVIAKCLEGAGAMIFEEQGYIGGGDNVDIMDQVAATAVEIGKSASPENISAVFDQAPEAYNEYLASQRGRY